MNTIFRISSLLFLLSILTGCWFESEKNIHSGLKSYTISSFFGTGRIAFSSENKKQYIFVSSQGNTARLHLSLGLNDGNPAKAEFHEIVRPPSLPKGYYYGVWKSDDGKFNYFPFAFHTDSFTWIKPSDTPIKVKSLAELDKLILEGFEEKTEEKFSRLGQNEAQSAWRKSDAAISSFERNKPSNRKAEKDRKREQIKNKIDDLDVGDGVYVEGIFSDELAQIIRIDKSRSRVKVRRSEDNTTAWVSVERIITREEALGNKFERGAAAVSIAICLFDPDSCK